MNNIIQISKGMYYGCYVFWILTVIDVVLYVRHYVIHRITFYIQVEYHGMYDRLDILRRQHFIYFCQHYQKKRMLKFQ